MNNQEIKTPLNAEENKAVSEWKEKKMSQIVEIKVSNVDKKIYPNKTLVKLCNYMDAYSNDYIANKLPFSIGSADSNEIQKFGLKQGDVIITKDSESPDDIAVSSVVIEPLENVVCGYHLAILRPNKNELDGCFLMMKLKLPDLKNYFFGVANGSTRYGLTIGNIENAKISFPPLPQQQKIAKILSTADAVIEKTQAAIAKYKAIKQGLLHDLFTRGVVPETVKVQNEKGEEEEKTVWKLRPTYQEAPHLYKESKLGMVPIEWEVLTVADVSENLDGKRIPVKQQDRDLQEEIYPYYGASGIIDYVENFIFNEPLILLGEDGENVISRNVPLAFKVEGKIWVNNHAHVLKPIDNVTIIDFLCETLEAIDYSSIVSGSAQPKITQGHLSKILLKIPNIEEQIIIGKKIKAINKKLQTEQAYLQKLYRLKAGLMGDLLSGRVRVKEA
ncbi:restriction endonuclease subunit S [Runella sp.]|uniref:restriction endonuclease subunit S n=1 Tax=Runella sp. TaxID=1960881 RepID=UPI00301687F5